MKEATQANFVEEDGWKLVDALYQEPVAVGDTVVSGMGESCKVAEGSHPPNKPGSTGRIVIRDKKGNIHEYFPGVFGCVWVRIDS